MSRVRKERTNKIKHIHKHTLIDATVAKKDSRSVQKCACFLFCGIFIFVWMVWLHRFARIFVVVLSANGVSETMKSRALVFEDY